MNGISDVNTVMSSQDKFSVENQVNLFNKSLEIEGRKPTKELGKDDFLFIRRIIWNIFPYYFIFFVHLKPPN